MPDTPQGRDLTPEPDEFTITVVNGKVVSFNPPVPIVTGALLAAAIDATLADGSS